MNSVATQGVLVATGLQDKFSWKSVAASAIGAAIGNQIGNSLGETDWGKANPRAANVVGGVSSGLTAAAVRHGITGDDIDYSQVAAESFAHAIGGIIANESRQPQEAETSKSVSETDPIVDPITGEHIRMGRRNDATAEDNARTDQMIDVFEAFQNSGRTRIGPPTLALNEYAGTVQELEQEVVTGRRYQPRYDFDGGEDFNALAENLPLSDGVVHASDIDPSNGRSYLYNLTGMPTNLGELSEIGATLGGIGQSLLDNLIVEPGKMAIDFINLANPQTYFSRAQGQSTTLSSLGNALENGASARDIASGIYNGITSYPDRFGQAIDSGDPRQAGYVFGEGLSLVGGGLGVVRGVNALRSGGLGFKLPEEVANTAVPRIRLMPSNAPAGNILQMAEIGGRTLGTLRNFKGEILKLAGDAQVGVRGSVIRGLKGPQKGFEPFNPNDFDIDAFIISDSLSTAKSTRLVGGFRFSTDKEFVSVQRNIQRSLKDQFPGLRVGKDRFQFRIFTEREFAEKYGPQAPFYILGK